MARLDATYAQLQKDATDSSKSAEERTQAEKDLQAREKLLLPTYTSIAINYADLHE